MPPTRVNQVPTDWLDLAVRAAQIYTGALTDVLDELGERSRTLPPDLLPLREGMRLAGPAFPVEGVPAVQLDRETSIRGILTMLAEVPAYHVVVYQTHDVASRPPTSASSRSRPCAHAAARAR
ncbi:MAG: hypothetical protein ABR569_11425 [Gaiellaceae bacterium]